MESFNLDSRVRVTLDAGTDVNLAVTGPARQVFAYLDVVARVLQTVEACQEGSDGQ